MFWITFNTVILMSSAFYLMFYSRVYESFGMFIKMCKDTLTGIQSFLIFLFFWIFLFAWLFKIAGSSVADDP